MRGRGRGRLAAVLLGALVVILAGPRAARAQGQPGDVRIGITYTPGYVPGLAMMPVSGGDAMARVSARIDTIVRQDLTDSDRFQMLAVPDSLRGGGRVNYGLWNQLGAVWLVTSQLSGSADAPLLRVGLHDVVYSTLKNIQAFTLPAPDDPDFRMAVHRVSDALVQWATGSPGIAATRIVFRRKEGDGNSDIYAVDSDGANLRRLTRDSSIVYSPTLSPDGSKLLFVSYRNGGPAVYEKDLSSGATRVISREPGLNITPAYSSDGKYIFLARTVNSDHSEVFRLKRDPLCCGQRVTYTNSGDALSPSPAPGGDRIAFNSSALGEPQIFVQDVGGSKPLLVSRYVYGEQGYSTSPDWSPQGDRIAYQGWVDGVFEIMTVSPDGGDRRILTSSGRNEDPSWAPDGRHLVFASDRNGYHSLLILDTVTGNVRELTVNHVDQLADWSLSLPAPSP